MAGRAARRRASTPAPRRSRRDLGGSRSHRRVPRRRSAAGGAALVGESRRAESWESHAASRSSSQRAPPRLRRRRRLRRAAIAGLVGLLAAAIVLAGVFLRARNDAIHRANVALSRERAASALAELSDDPQTSLRLALQSVDALAGDDAATPADRRQAVAALRQALTQSRRSCGLDRSRGRGRVSAFRPDRRARRNGRAGRDGARVGREHWPIRSGPGSGQRAAGDRPSVPTGSAS